MIVNLDERLAWTLVGCAIGFVLGYITHALQTKTGKAPKKPRDERGFMRKPVVADALMLFALGLTVFAAISTGVTNDRVQENSKEVKANSEATQDVQLRIGNITTCNSQFLAETILALNERTEYSTKQADANVDLQKEQLRLLTIALSVPPPRAEEGQEAVDRYLKKLDTYVDLAAATATKAANNAYPTLSDFTKCVNGLKEKK